MDSSHPPTYHSTLGSDWYDNLHRWLQSLPAAPRPQIQSLLGQPHPSIKRGAHVRSGFVSGLLVIENSISQGNKNFMFIPINTYKKLKDKL